MDSSSGWRAVRHRIGALPELPMLPDIDAILVLLVGLAVVLPLIGLD